MRERRETGVGPQTGLGRGGIQQGDAGGASNPGCPGLASRPDWGKPFLWPPDTVLDLTTLDLKISLAVKAAATWGTRRLQPAKQTSPGVLQFQPLNFSSQYRFHPSFRRTAYFISRAHANAPLGDGEGLSAFGGGNQPKP